MLRVNTSIRERPKELSPYDVLRPAAYSQIYRAVSSVSVAASVCVHFIRTFIHQAVAYNAPGMAGEHLLHVRPPEVDNTVEEVGDPAPRHLLKGAGPLQCG